MISFNEGAGWEFPGRREVLDYLRRIGRDRLVEEGAPGIFLPPGQGEDGLGIAAPWGFLPQEALPLTWHTLVMGILNVTPDSFSDGGRYPDPEAAIQHGLEMARAGADVLDVGGESTRPGARPVPAEEEMRRVLPVIEGLAGRVQVPISIDTSKAQVAEAALQAGARIVNDVTGLRGDKRMAETVARWKAGVIVMHMRGTPENMQHNPHYESVVGEILAFLAERVEQGVAAGIERDRIWVDPGIGFGKNLEHNLELLRSLRVFGCLGCPLVIGPSRKSFIGHLLGLPVEQRFEGTAATVALAVAQGVHMVRVHDVASMVRVTRMSDALVRGWRRRRVYLSLGSNLGDRYGTLVQAVQAMKEWPDTEVEGCSSVYETDPVGYTDQPLFLNMVVALRTGLDPYRLLREAQALERQAGRRRTGLRWGPRTLDVDILLFGEVKSRAEWLTIPHPRMDERGFVLIPLAELAPGLQWEGKSIEERVAELRSREASVEESVRQVMPPPSP